MKRLRIGLLTSDDARDRSPWSGIPYYMAHALRRQPCEVAYLGPVYSPLEFFGKARSALSRALLGRRHPYHHTLALSKQYGRLFRKRLRDDLDVIFAPAGSTQVAFLETDIPIVYTSDTTFERMHGYYPAFSNLSAGYVAMGNEIEGRALRRASAVLYPSWWAAESAVGFYGVDASRVHIFPYGANLDSVPPADALAGAKRRDVCTLTFLGVDWERKGGPVAYDTVAALRQMGMDAELVVCGCIPPPRYRALWMRVIRRLDKNVPEQQAELSRLLLGSTFLLVPTRHECFGIAFCEASAHGTPSIATRTGGVAGAVQQGRNGFLLPPDAAPSEYARLIHDLFRDRERYLEMVASSREMYEESLNWDAWGARAFRIIEEVAG